jgi:hypothetical protein
MAGIPWHLEALGLPAHADGVAVRRSYAARLRQIDVAAQPEAFQQLRRAYEAARTWCYEHPAVDDAVVEAGADDPVVPAEPTEARATPLAAPPADTAAEDALRRLTDAVASAGVESIPALFDSALASLRNGYVDAPGQFEDLLVDALRHGVIAERPSLFDVADAAFHWHEVGRLRTADPRQLWIDRVLAQRETWRSYDAGWRETWLELLTRASRGLDPWLVRRWPDIGRLGETLPDWIMLYVTPAQLHAWAEAFHALPKDTRDEFTARAAPVLVARPGGKRVTRWRPRIRAALLLLWAVCTVVSIVMHAGDPRSGGGPSEPLPRFNQRADTPRECMALYARFEQPDPFKGISADEVVQLKRRAQRCALDSHWQAPPEP